MSAPSSPTPARPTPTPAPIEPPRSGSSWPLFLAGGLTGIAVVVVIVGALVRPWVAGQHAQAHALLSLVFLVPALLLAMRSSRGGAVTTPVIVGLSMVALAQVVEGLGGFGYGPSNIDRVNPLATLHDLGLVLTPLGLGVAVLCLALGASRVRMPRSGR